MGFQVAQVVKNQHANAGDIDLGARFVGFGSWVRKIPWREEWLPT